MEAEIKVDIAQAAQAAKARGKLPGKLAEVVADIINVKTPWFDILERYMVGLTKQDYTWTRPNRRFIGDGMYLPSTGVVPSMGELVVQGISTQDTNIVAAITLFSGAVVLLAGLLSDVIYAVLDPRVRVR